jgi:uncharacterized SAM-binding protein YcdF (DUF218 family)
MNDLDSINPIPGATQKTEGKPPSFRKILILFIVVSLIAMPLTAIFKYGEILAQSSLGTGGLETKRWDKRDCGIVLTGGAGRVREGIVLLSRGLINKLIISGVNPKSSFQDIYPDIAFYPDVNLSNVVLERTSFSTVSNAQSSLVIVEALSCKSVFLITSDYHMYRAMRTFQSVFPPTVLLDSYIVNSDQFPVGQNWVFSLKALGVVIEEAVKFFFYILTVF